MLTREETIVKVLEDKKAVNVEVIDLQNKDYIVDFVVIATTLNAKHGFALLNHLKDELKPSGEEFLRVDENEDWTVIDLGDAFIHLMNEKTRDKYSIEEFLSELETNKEG
ncbi:MAG: ribosome silencing factor [Arcobacter sp.]|uniref:ribosome silencing factor n=1 Tax=uncultured Arcobacter sp. TaxID=165434 RepID=UPI000CBF8E9F|nr:ribosome silencing factor [uncultured Arcobacter sp.]PLY08270.1 MAG: ribosome silencing factor [Arcobacter sp.]